MSIAGICAAVVLVSTFGSTSAQEPLVMNVMTFDGKSAYAEFPQNLFDNLTEGTVDLWVKWEKFNKWSRVLDFGIENRSFVIQTNNKDKAVNFRIWEGKRNDKGIKSRKILKQGAWHHLAAVFGRSGMAFYIDGNLIGTHGFEGGMDVGAGGNNYLGKSNWSGDKLFQGQMAELRVWDRRLSAEEIARYKDRTLRGTEPGLVGYWRLGDLDGERIPSAIAGGYPGRVEGRVGVRTIPAIRRFLVVGQLEIAAEHAYAAADSAFAVGAYQQATTGFEAVLDLVPDFQDAEQRRSDAQYQWDLQEAEKAFEEAVDLNASGQTAQAYWAFDRAVQKVPDFKDAATKREEALQNARFEVGLFVLASDKVRERLTPTSEATGGRFGRMLSSISRAARVSLLKQTETLVEHQAYAYRIMEDLLDAKRAPYVQLRRRGEMRRLIEQSGANPDLAHYDQVIQASQAAGIPVLVFAELTEAYTTLEKKQANVIVWTTKQVDYTDEKGKKRKREVGDKSYKTVRQWVDTEMHCTLNYRILNTATGAIIGEGAFSASDGDAVDFIAWNRYEGVDPSRLRTKDGTKFRMLSSDLRSAIDARSSLKSDTEMYRTGVGYIAEELGGRLLETLMYYSPRK